MNNLVTIRPGARGSIKLVRKYGKKLVCVRYRYNPVSQKRIKTVELIVDERPWKPQNCEDADTIAEEAATEEAITEEAVSEEISETAPIPAPAQS